MNNLTTTELNAALEWRYATKQFDAARKIDEAQLDALLESLRLAPSSFGLQPWKFIVVDDPSLREQLRAQSWNQPQVTDASHLVVLATKKTMTSDDIHGWTATSAAIQNTPAESLEMLRSMMLGFIGHMDESSILQWNIRQVYIALGQLMTSAAVIGIDACPLEGINPVEYDTLLGLSGSDYQTVVACALGYRSDTDKYASIPKARKSAADVVVRI